MHSFGCAFFLFYQNNLKKIWTVGLFYDIIIIATQVNIFIIKVCISTIKIHTLFSHTFMMKITCVAAIGVMYFSCAASAAHFLLNFIGGI